MGCDDWSQFSFVGQLRYPWSGYPSKYNYCSKTRKRMIKFRCTVHICNKRSNLFLAIVCGKRWSYSSTKSLCLGRVLAHVLLSYHKHYFRASHSCSQNSSFRGRSPERFKKPNSGQAKEILEHTRFTTLRKGELQNNVSFNAVVPKSLAILENIKNVDSIS